MGILTVWLVVRGPLKKNNKKEEKNKLINELLKQPFWRIMFRTKALQ